MIRKVMFIISFWSAALFSQTLETALRIYEVRIQFPIPIAEDLHQGYVDARVSSSGPLPIQIDVPEGIAWQLNVQTIDPYFSPVQWHKPHYDLLWKQHHEPDALFRPLNLQEIGVVTGTSSMRVELDFRLKIDWTDPPGEYNLDVIFELERLDE